MIRLAVIGSNWISHQFIDAAHLSGKYRLSAVYSRTLSQAQAFAGRYSSVELFTDLQQLAAKEAIDAVYIASPNALHFSQICLFLKHKKHVICEKPLTSSLWQTEAVIACARQNQVILFEAFKTASLPNFKLISQLLDKPGKVRKVLFSFCQHSSRYPCYLNGELPNVFNPAFSGGSLMDIGYYCLSSALALWGEPDAVHASASLLNNGVDAHGSVIMQYGDFDITLWHSKVSDSVNQSEIQGELGLLLIDRIADCMQISWQPRKGEVQQFGEIQHNNNLIYEANDFARLIANRTINHPALALTRITAKWLDIIRAQTGVHFPADTEHPTD